MMYVQFKILSLLESHQEEMMQCIKDQVLSCNKNK